MPLFGRKKATPPEPAPAAPEPAPAADAPPPPADAASAAVAPDWTVGCSVSLQTTLQEAPLDGDVFAYDPATRVLVLATPGSAPFNARLRMINAAAVTAVLAATPPPAGGPTAGPAAVPLPPLDPAKCRDRLDRATAAANAAAAKVGVGVSARGQAVFDALDRTLPCAWDGDAVVVLGEVRVGPPYDVGGGVAANASDTATLDRVAMVLAEAADRLPAHEAVAAE